MNDEAKTNHQPKKETAVIGQQATPPREDESSVRPANQYQKENGDLFFEFMRNFPGGVSIKDSDRRIIFLTEKAEEYFGIRPDEWIGKKSEEIWPPEIAARLKKNDEKVLNGNIVHSIAEGPQKGEPHKWMIHRFPIKRSNKPPLIGGISIDITRGIGLEEKLRESEELFRALFDHSLDCVSIHDFDGNFIDANLAALILLGCRREDIVSLNLSSLFDSQQRERAVKTLIELKKNGVQKEAIEYKINTSDGKYVHIETMTSLIYRNNAPYAILAIARDVTERKRTEEALRQETSFRKAVIENVSEGLCVCLQVEDDPYLIFTVWNKRMTEITGYTMEEINRLGWYKIISTDSESEKWAKNRISEICENKENNPGDWQITTASGEKRILKISTSILGTDDGQKHVLSLINDVTERKLAEEELKKHRNHLEVLVKERTSELAKMNKQLLFELAERRRAEADLREKGKELKIHVDKLEELTTALKILLKQRDADKGEMEEKVISNVKELLLPYLEELKERPLDAKSKAVLNILESNLHGITSSFVHKLSSKYLSLTPREIQITDLIRQEKSTKEISSITGISISSINIHRNHIRTKLGIIAKKINLKSHLKSFS